MRGINNSLLGLVLGVLLFFFLVFFFSQSAEVRITAGTDTCWEAAVVQPSPLRVAEEKLFFFLLVIMEEGKDSFPPLVVLLEKVESRREEMVDLQRVDWIIEGIDDGFGSDSEMGWFKWFKWVLGFLNFMCSPTVGVCVATGMILKQRLEWNNETGGEGRK